jgi:hypothetical protein
VRTSHLPGMSPDNPPHNELRRSTADPIHIDAGRAGGSCADLEVSRFRVAGRWRFGAAGVGASRHHPIG